MHNNMPGNKIIDKSIVVLLLLILSINIFLNSSAYAIESDELGQIQHSIEVKRKRTKAKILELKLREKKEINKLYNSQDVFERTKKDLSLIETNYKSSKKRLSNIQYKLNTEKTKYSKQEQLAGIRLKQIYKGERLNILHIIFATDNVNDLLDKLYYQTKITDHDKTILSDINETADKYQRLLKQEESQKKNILYALRLKKNKKQKIANAISTSQYLINKLRTDRATYEQAEKELEQQSAKIASMLKNGIKGVDVKFDTISHFVKPISGRISSPFGWRKHPIFGSRSFHSGIDIAGLNLTPVRASNSGKVVYSGWYGGYGKVVIVNHGKYNGQPTSSLYAHLARTVVKVGDTVETDKIVGYEGSTGYSTGPHLHFEIRVDGKPNNPMNFIN